MVRRRAAAAGIATKIGNHTFRATGITAYFTAWHQRRGWADTGEPQAASGGSALPAP